jgi:hypothetical protein
MIELKSKQKMKQSTNASFCNSIRLDYVLLKLIAFLIFSLATSPANADAVGDDFFSQCPVLQGQLDKFANICLLNAREQESSFDGESEVHGAYFGSASPGSHFALGCTLNWKHQIDFIGVYYSVNGNNFALANLSPLAYVDFFGNAGTVVGGKLANFVMIRQFGDASFPPHFQGNIVKNCENSESKTHEIYGTFGGSFSLRRRFVLGKDLITGCIGGACLPEVPYTQFFGTADSPVIYNGQFFTFLIEDDGSLLVANHDLAKYCPTYRENEASGKLSKPSGFDMLREICLIN